MQWHPKYEEKETYPRNILGEILDSTLSITQIESRTYISDWASLLTPLRFHLIYLSVIIIIIIIIIIYLFIYLLLNVRFRSPLGLRGLRLIYEKKTI